MFRTNEQHLQENFWGFRSQLPAKQQKELEQTAEYAFYHLIFCYLDEEDFACLYSQVDSRPNAPVNCMIAALTLMQNKGWTYEELFKQMTFNMLTRTALGLKTFGENPFNPATLFNFQNRIAEHFLETGINLLETVFDKLTAKQIKALKIKTNIQRTDSFAANSNIVNYTRVRLLVEMVIRLYRILDEKDKVRCKERFWEYTQQDSGHYIYQLQKEEVPHKLEQIGQLYNWAVSNLEEKYGRTTIFQTFKRVYEEHFTAVENKVEVKPATELSSGSLQSPDDREATYRQKRGKGSKGYSVNISETAHPDNKINLVVDIAVEPNNTDDSVILNQRLDKMKTKTPDLEELHVDGAYGSTDNDRKLEDKKITLVQTGVRGPEAKHAIDIKQKAEDTYMVSCPHQAVESIPTRKRHRACFDPHICDCVPGKGTYYFTAEDYLRKQRHQNLLRLPRERRKIRPNVEATVQEFKRKLDQGKLRVRSRFKAEVYAFTTGITVNFGRIFRYQTESPGKVPTNVVNVLQNTAIFERMNDLMAKCIEKIECYFKILFPKHCVFCLAVLPFLERTHV